MKTLIANEHSLYLIRYNEAREDEVHVGWMNSGIVFNDSTFILDEHNNPNKWFSQNITKPQRYAWTRDYSTKLVKEMK